MYLKDHRKKMVAGESELKYVEHIPYLQLRETVGRQTIYGIIEKYVTIGYFVSEDQNLNGKEWKPTPGVEYPKEFPLVKYKLAGMRCSRTV